MRQGSRVNSVQRFYDQLADSYHLIFDDWAGEAVPRQGQALAELIRAQQGSPPLAILDCTCGIGTQAIGLAMQGYQVTGSDISARTIERARVEAQRQGVAVTFLAADVRSLSAQVEGSFDVVLSCDNALPHLLTEEDLKRAARSMWDKLKLGGLLIVGIRDYDRTLEERPTGTTPRVFSGAEGRRVVFQTWDWAMDSRTYTLTLFILRERPDGWGVSTYTTAYRALRREELTALLQAAGFHDVRWHMPEETGHPQPLVTARKHSESGQDSHVRTLVRHWDAREPLTVATPHTGVNNEVYLVTTDHGEYVLRVRPAADRDIVVREHALIAYAHTRGVPAVVPLPLPDGATLLQRGGYCSALFTRAPGKQVPRQKLAPVHARAMGICMAELHEALQNYPTSLVRHRSFDFDPEDTKRQLDALIATVRALPAPDEVDRAALDRLTSRRTWFEHSTLEVPAEFASLPRQALHGDFQEANLFFADDHVSAIVDWDQAEVAPRAWEVLRTLHLAFHLVPQLCATFLDGYRTRLPLDSVELQIVAQAYGAMRAHDVWLYRTVYLEGNARARVFIWPGRFVPFPEQWARIDGVLQSLMA